MELSIVTMNFPLLENKPFRELGKTKQMFNNQFSMLNFQIAVSLSYFFIFLAVVILLATIAISSSVSL